MLSRICKSVKRLEKNFSKNFLAGKGRGRRKWGAWYKKSGDVWQKFSPAAQLRRRAEFSNGYSFFQTQIDHQDGDVGRGDA